MTRRGWGDDFQLRDLLDAQSGGLEFATRDFALLTVMRSTFQPTKSCWRSARGAREGGVGD